MKVFKGIDLTEMPAFVKSPKEGRVLLLDGDAAAYRAAATVAKLDTAVRKFWTLVYEEMYVTEAATAVVHLTSQDCTKLNRKYYPTAKPYQGNRKGKAKPPLLEPLRELLGVECQGENAEVVLNREMEADDAIISSALMYGDVVISSADKDLRQTTRPYFESTLGFIRELEGVGWAEIAYTQAGAPKLVGHGQYFLLAQWLAGDPADNVAGLLSYKGRKIGVVGAVKLLEEWSNGFHFKSFDECILNIIKAYAKIKQDPLAELAMVYLHHPSDSAFRWLLDNGLQNLDSKWTTWLKRLHARHLQIVNRRLQDDEDGEDTAASVDD